MIGMLMSWMIAYAPRKMDADDQMNLHTKPGRASVTILEDDRNESSAQSSLDLHEPGREPHDILTAKVDDNLRDDLDTPFQKEKERGKEETTESQRNDQKHQGLAELA